MTAFAKPGDGRPRTRRNYKQSTRACTIHLFWDALCLEMEKKLFFFFLFRNLFYVTCVMLNATSASAACISRQAYGPSPPSVGLLVPTEPNVAAGTGRPVVSQAHAHAHAHDTARPLGRFQSAEATELLRMMRMMWTFFSLSG